MKTLIIYHRADLDGMVSCALIFEKNHGATIMGWDYGDKIDLDYICSFKKVFILDISFDIKTMIKISWSTKLTWIDHHKTAYEQYQSNFEDFEPTTLVIFPEENDWNHSTTDLIYKLYNDNYPAMGCEGFLYELGRYDIWDKSNLKWWNNIILPIVRALQLLILSPSDYFEVINEYPKENIHKLGFYILLKEEKQAEENAKFVELKVFIEEKYLLSNVGKAAALKRLEQETVAGEKIDFICVWQKKGELYSYSLYAGNTPDYDVSIIAKRFGGGGHKGAAGFSLNEFLFN